MNEFEALQILRAKGVIDTRYCRKIELDKCLEVIEKAILELKAIKEAKPSEAMKCLNDMERDLYVGDYYKNNIAFIKQALLKAEKLEKAWDIVKEKNVDIETLKYRLRVKDDDVYLHYKYDLLMPREEFDLLKEVLK